MVGSFPFSILVGTVLGFLSGLGTGGGSLLLMWLTVALHMDPATARSVNLLFYIPSALVACLFHWRQGSLNYRKIFPAVLAGCAAAGIFSWISGMLDVTVLKKLFGGLLLFTGIRELLFKPAK